MFCGHGNLSLFCAQNRQGIVLDESRQALDDEEPKKENKVKNS